MTDLDKKLPEKVPLSVGKEAILALYHDIKANNYLQNKFSSTPTRVQFQVETEAHGFEYCYLLFSLSNLFSPEFISYHEGQSERYDCMITVPRLSTYFDKPLWCLYNKGKDHYQVESVWDPPKDFQAFLLFVYLIEEYRHIKSIENEFSPRYGNRKLFHSHYSPPQPLNKGFMHGATDYGKAEDQSLLQFLMANGKAITQEEFMTHCKVFEYGAIIDEFIPRLLKPIGIADCFYRYSDDFFWVDQGGYIKLYAFEKDLFDLAFKRNIPPLPNFRLPSYRTLEYFGFYPPNSDWDETKVEYSRKYWADLFCRSGLYLVWKGFSFRYLNYPQPLNLDPLKSPSKIILKRKPFPRDKMR